MEQQSVAKTTQAPHAPVSLSRQPSTQLAVEHPSALLRSMGNRALGQLIQTRLAIQRQCSCGGECESCRSQNLIQTKMAISSSGDKYELEADRVASQITQPPANSVEIPIDTGVHGMQAGMIAPARHPAISALSSSGLDTVEAPSPALLAIESRLPQLEGGGNPLPQSMRHRMEGRFGFDFSSVRIHHDFEASRLNDNLNSLAFTHGRNIFFASGAYRPGTSDGDRLLAHELTHVVQQSGGAAGGRVFVQRYEEVMIRGDLIHSTVEQKLREKNPTLVTEAKVPGGTTNKKELDAVGRPDLYKSNDPPGVTPGVRGEFAKTDPDKRSLLYSNLSQTRAQSGSGIRSSPKVGPGGAFVGSFPNILVGDLKPLGIDKIIAGKLHIGPKIGEGMAQIGNYKQGYEEFTQQAVKDGRVSAPATAQNLSELTIPQGLDYRNFKTEAAATTPGEGAIVVGSKNARYWIFPVSEWGLYAYFTLPHPFNAPKLKEAVDNVFKELNKFTATLKQKKTPVDTSLVLTKRRPVGSPARVTAIQRKDNDKTDWGALGKQWEKQRAHWDRDFGKPFLAKEGSQMGEKVAIDYVLGSKGPFKDDAAPQVKEFHSVELWSGLSGTLLVKGRALLGSAFDKIVQFYEYIRKKFTGFHEKMKTTNPSGYGWKGKVIKVIVEALKIGFKELLVAIYRIFAACFSGVMDKVIASFTDQIEDSLADQLKGLHELFDRFHDQVKTEFEARFGSWDKMIEELQTGAKIVSVIMSLVDVVRLIIQIISCLAPPAAGCLWGLVVNLAGEVALELGIPLILDSSQFREQIVQPAVQDLVKEYAGEEIQGVIDFALSKVGLTDYSKEVAECRIKGAAKPVNQLLSPLSGGLTGSALIAHRDQWQNDHRGELMAQIAPAFVTSSGRGATPSDIQDLIDLIARQKPTRQQIRSAFENAQDPQTKKIALAPARNALSGTPQDLFTEPPSISKPAVPPPKSGITFGPLTPIPGGADKGPGYGGPTLTIPLP